MGGGSLSPMLTVPVVQFSGNRSKVITREHGLHAHIVFTDHTVYVEKGEQIDYFARASWTSRPARWMPSWGLESLDMGRVMSVQLTDANESGCGSIAPRVIWARSRPGLVHPSSLGR